MMNSKVRICGSFKTSVKNSDEFINVLKEIYTPDKIRVYFPLTVDENELNFKIDSCNEDGTCTSITTNSGDIYKFYFEEGVCSLSFKGCLSDFGSFSLLRGLFIDNLTIVFIESDTTITAKNLVNYINELNELNKKHGFRLYDIPALILYNGR